MRALGLLLVLALCRQASPALSAPFAYVANTDSASISVFDTASTRPAVVATVPLKGEERSGFVAVYPAGTRVFTFRFDRFLSVIDTATNTVIDRVDLGFFAYHAATSLDGTRLYITDYSSPRVKVLDTTTNTVIPFGNWSKF